MATKFKVRTEDEACECPFYVEDTKGRCSCFWKKITTSSTVVAITEDNPEYDTDIWDVDCNGLYGNCTFLPLLYKLPTQEISNKDAIDDYNPFEDESEDSEEITEKIIKVKVATVKKAPIKKQAEAKVVTNNTIKGQPKCRVLVTKVANPFAVETDVFVMPANVLLDIDEPMGTDLLRMTNGYAQEQCHAMVKFENYNQRNIELGNVYQIRSGLNHIKAIYHAVVVTHTRVVSGVCIAESIQKALIQAESAGASTVTMLPFDYGLLDVSQAALMQLNAIRDYLKVTPNTSLKNIYIVMDDDFSVGVYNDYYSRVFRS